MKWVEIGNLILTAALCLAFYRHVAKRAVNPRTLRLVDETGEPLAHRVTTVDSAGKEIVHYEGQDEDLAEQAIDALRQIPLDGKIQHWKGPKLTKNFGVV